jgi:polysaccharide export outer membrane protein
MRFRQLTVVTAIAIFVASASAAPQAVPQKNVTMAFGDSEFRLGPDDLIRVFVWKEPELSSDPVVRPDGIISLPLIGELSASGKTCLELESEIGKKLSEYVSNPVVNVIVKEVNSLKFSVLGEVKTPGVYKIKNRMSVIDAVAQAGGFTEYASRDKVTVIRNNAAGEQKRFRVDIDKLIKSPDSKMFYVLPSDTIYVQ